MRVKIAYSAELDEIPSEVRDLLKKAHIWLDKASSEIISIRDSLERASFTGDGANNSTPDVELLIKKWPEIREYLFKADSVLMDTSHMMGGYYGAKISSSNQIEEAQEEPDDTEG
tara:strand:- start:673 stop:1017 length:345 start_codon:yes stop_codon:yes gene_type:complete